MLIENLRQDVLVSDFICDECSENGFKIEFNKALDAQNDLLVIKVDNYFNSLRIEKRPPSPDCLILIRCKTKNTFDLFIVELKDIGNKKGFDIKNIRAKFETCIYQYMSDIHRQYFFNENVHFNLIRLIFICDPYNENELGDRIRYTKATKMDSLLALNMKPLRFDGKALFIEHFYTNFSIKPCLS